jgi:hypothetical protein
MQQRSAANIRRQAARRGAPAEFRALRRGSRPGSASWRGPEGGREPRDGIRAACRDRLASEARGESRSRATLSQQAPAFTAGLSDPGAISGRVGQTGRAPSRTIAPVSKLFSGRCCALRTHHRRREPRAWFAWGASQAAIWPRRLRPARSWAARRRCSSQRLRAASEIRARPSALKRLGFASPRSCSSVRIASVKRDCSRLRSSSDFCSWLVFTVTPVSSSFVGLDVPETGKDDGRNAKKRHLHPDVFSRMGGATVSSAVGFLSRFGFRLLQRRGIGAIEIVRFQDRAAVETLEVLNSLLAGNNLDTPMWTRLRRG